MKAGHSKNVWKISTVKKKINLLKFTVMTRVMGGGVTLTSDNPTPLFCKWCVYCLDTGYYTLYTIQAASLKPS